jgi:hypothetical protein
MWSNHSETMVHVKFRFVHSLNIEREWLNLKRKFSTITWCQKASGIQDWCNVYTMHRSIIKNEYKYSFWLKMIKFYYHGMVNDIWSTSPSFDRDTWPYLTNIDRFEELVRNDTRGRCADKIRLQQWAPKDNHFHSYTLFFSETLSNIPLRNIDKDFDIDPNFRQLARIQKRKRTEG